MIHCAVITGDIVDSTALSAARLDTVFQELSGATREIALWSNAPAYLSRRGGDGWQMALIQPDHALRAAIFLQAILRRMDQDIETRMAIATGSGQLAEGDSPDLNAAHGDVFTRSGRLLPEIKKPFLMDWADAPAKATALRLMDYIAQGWTAAQARAVAEALSPVKPTRQQIATNLGISRQAVNQALWSAGYLFIEDALAKLNSDTT